MSPYHTATGLNLINLALMIHFLTLAFNDLNYISTTELELLCIKQNNINFLYIMTIFNILFLKLIRINRQIAYPFWPASL
jgi:hypothetical protein